MKDATIGIDSLVDVLPCGIATIDLNGRILQSNTTLALLLGYAEGELNGLPFSNILTTAGNIFYQTHFFPLLQMQGEANEIFFTLSRRDGSKLPVMINAAKHQDVFILVLVHVPQRAKYEEEILQARKTAEQALADNKVIQALQSELKTQLRHNDRYISRLKDKNREYVQLSKVTSHNLSERVRKLFVNLDLLQIKCEEVTQPLVKNIQQHAGELKAIITALHRFVAIDIMQEKPERIDLLNIIHQANQKVRANTGFTDFGMRVDGLVTIEGYASSLETMFFELLKNAVQFRKPGKDLFIEVRGVIVQENVFRENSSEYRYEDFIKISIRDNGSGFDDKYSDYVFEIFNKLNNHSKVAGVGLPLARKIVMKHHGNIKIQTVAGEGTTVIIHLPLVQASQAPA